MSQPDPLFLALVKRAKLPEPVAEYRFDPTRRWRADYAWPEHKLALEVEGGVWTNGRHTRGAGFLNDMSKYNRLACLGWRLLRCTPAGLHDLWTITQLTEALERAA
jgi:very-short-patch-repair endonuclease